MSQNKYLNQVNFLGLLTVGCILLSFFRWYYTGTKVFLFLNWNLILAIVPWLISRRLLNQKTKPSKISLVVMLFSWLLFFPNAPYILTDLFHLNSTSNMPIWFDLILILMFAWTGMLFGFISLWNMETLFKSRMKYSRITIWSSLLLFVCSFGIYLGRYLRWNSWDVIQNPMGIVGDVGERFMSPFDHPRTWGMTVLMGILLNVIYWTFHLLRDGTISVIQKGVLTIDD